MSITSNNFTELSANEIQDIDGGNATTTVPFIDTGIRLALWLIESFF